MVKITAVKNKERVHPFSKIEQVSKFQNYGGLYIKNPSFILDKEWPKEVRTFSGTIYRVVSLKKEVFAALMAGKKYKWNSASSWTTDQSIAKEFLSEPWFVEHARNKVPMLLRIKYSGKAFDIAKFHALPSVKRSIEFWEEQGKRFSEGLSIGGYQKEIVLPAGVTLSIESVLSYWDGHKWSRSKNTR